MMDQKQLLRQMVDFQKTAFDASFNAMSVMQERSEKVMGMFLNQGTWFSEKWQDAMIEWTKACQQGCDTFKKAVEDNLSQVNSFTNRN